MMNNAGILRGQLQTGHSSLRSKVIYIYLFDCFFLLWQEMCLPSSDTIISQLKDLITKYKAKSVYLARDDKKYDSLITAELDKMSVSTV